MIKKTYLQTKIDFRELAFTTTAVAGISTPTLFCVGRQKRKVLVVYISTLFTNTTNSLISFNFNVRNLISYPKNYP